MFLQHIGTALSPPPWQSLQADQCSSCYSPKSLDATSTTLQHAHNRAPREQSRFP